MSQPRGRRRPHVLAAESAGAATGSVCREFGYDNLGTILGRLREAPVDPASGEPDYGAVLSVYLTGAARVTRDRLAGYAANIAGHSERGCG